MANKNDRINDKLIIAMALLTKAMEQMDSILKQQEDTYLCVAGGW